MLPVVLTEAAAAAEFAAARVLFREYAAGLGVDLCFQGFEAELDKLPEMYGAPQGCLFVARSEDRLVGCGALRRLSAGKICEMKRLYVRAEARGTGLGRLLAESLIAKGRAQGYEIMRLDTLAHMAAARSLYRSLGFVETFAYYDNPLPDVVYMELDLTAG
jgi:ribosomal protein S18 acetylase RimI-like enzyme